MRARVLWAFAAGVTLALLGIWIAAYAAPAEQPSSSLAYNTEAPVQTPGEAPAEKPVYVDDFGVDIEQATELLDEMQRTYTHLDGVTVRGGPTPNGEQAVAYYRRGRILIDPAHVASLEKIVAHEIWHIIDWRDNGRIDWYEDVPPAEWADYLKQ